MALARIKRLKTSLTHTNTTDNKHEKIEVETGIAETPFLVLKSALSFDEQKHF